MTTHQAKKIVKTYLDGHLVRHDKLTAQTVGFSGFGLDDQIFVEVHGNWNGTLMEWEVLKALAKANDFCVEGTSNGFSI